MVRWAHSCHSRITGIGVDIATGAQRRIGHGHSVAARRWWFAGCGLVRDGGVAQEGRRCAFRLRSCLASSAPGSLNRNIAPPPPRPSYKSAACDRPSWASLIRPSRSLATSAVLHNVCSLPSTSLSRRVLRRLLILINHFTARNSTTSVYPGLFPGAVQETYWGQFEEISKYNVSLNYFEKLWLAWYTYMQNDVLATGIMSFVMHEAVYFGRSLPWIIIDCMPYFRKYKIQNVCISPSFLSASLSRNFFFSFATTPYQY